MSLYQEPDGTRRLLNYLLDNLAGAIKRSESLCGSSETGPGLAYCKFLFTPKMSSVDINVEIVNPTTYGP